MPMDFQGSTQPPTFEEAVEFIVLNLNEDEKDGLRKDGAKGMHFGPCMAMRNGWNLWGVGPEKSRTLHEHFVERFRLGCADDMSGMIMAGVIAQLRGETLDLDAEVKRYHDHWARYEIDPATMKKIEKKKWWKL